MWALGVSAIEMAEVFQLSVGDLFLSYSSLKSFAINVSCLIVNIIILFACILLIFDDFICFFLSWVNKISGVATKIDCASNEGQYLLVEYIFTALLA